MFNLISPFKTKRKSTPAVLETSSPTNQAILAVGQERERIMADIHDSVLNPLLSTTFLISSLKDSAHIHSPELLNQRIDIIVNQINSICNTLRNIGQGTSPLNTVGKDIHSLTQSLIQPVKDLQIFKNILLEHNAITFHLLHEQRETLLFIIQELINNSIKHSGASEVKVQLIWSTNYLELVYKDNGKGIPHDAILNINTKSKGISNIYARASKISQSYGFESDYAYGTKFNLHLNRIK